MRSLVRRLFGDKDELHLRLRKAVIRGKQLQVKSLLDKGASPVWMNRKSDRGSPPDVNALVLACKQGDVDILGLLVDACYRNRFPINSFGKEMHIATIRYSKWKAFLLLHQRQVPMTGSSSGLPMPIFAAAEGGKHEMLAYLLRTYPVDWREYEFKGHSLLSIASKNGRYECVDLLLYSQYSPCGELLEFAIECARAYRQAHILCLLTSALPNFVDSTIPYSAGYDHRRSSIAMTDPMSDGAEEDDRWSPPGRRNTRKSSYNQRGSLPAAPPPTRASARSLVFGIEDPRPLVSAPSQQQQQQREEEGGRTSGETDSEYGSYKSLYYSDIDVPEKKASPEEEKPMKKQDLSLHLVPHVTSQASGVSYEGPLSSSSSSHPPFSLVASPVKSSCRLSRSFKLPVSSSTSSFFNEDELEIHKSELLSGSAFNIGLEVNTPLSSGSIVHDNAEYHRDSSESLSEAPRSSDCLLKADVNGLLSYCQPRSRSGSEDRKKRKSSSSFDDLQPPCSNTKQRTHRFPLAFESSASTIDNNANSNVVFTFTTHHSSNSYGNSTVNSNTSTYVPPRSTARMKRTLSTLSLPSIAECSAWEEKHEMDEDC